MSQGGNDTAVVTADTSKPKPQRIVKNAICIIIGDMTKDGHNLEVVNAFLVHGYNMVILYSNEDKTDEKDIGGWIVKNFGHQIVDISKIDVKSSDAINKVFTHLASKLTSDEWSQCQVTVLIYNAALGLVKLVGSKDDEKKDSDNNKNDLTLKELAYYHNIAAHGFIHCVKEGLKFFDSKSKCNFDILYGKPQCNPNSQLMKIIDYGTSLIKNHIKNGTSNWNNKRLHIINMPADGHKYLCAIWDAIGDLFLNWANVYMTCEISADATAGNTTTTIYLSTANVGGNTPITLTDSYSESNVQWTMGVSNDGDSYSLHYIIGATDASNDTYALTINADGSVLGNSSSIASDNEKWSFEPILLGDPSDPSSLKFAQQYRIVNEGRKKALTYVVQFQRRTGKYVFTLMSTQYTESAKHWQIKKV